MVKSHETGTLNGKVAIVTGSATGIGAASAIALAEHGANVLVNYSRNEADAHAIMGGANRNVMRSNRKQFKDRSLWCLAPSTLRGEPDAILLMYPRSETEVPMLLATLTRATIVASIFVLPPMAGCKRPFSKELALGETPRRAIAAALFDDHPISGPATMRPQRVEAIR